jgi:hypothetical protein
MRNLLLVLALALLSCTSADRFAGENVQQCAPGDPIEINAGFERSSRGQEMVDDRLELLVEIANNSEEDVVVEAIRVDPMSSMSGQQRYELIGGRITPRQTVAEADAQLFRVPMSARRLSEAVPRGFSGIAEVAVVVELDGGRRYRCRFQVGR